MKRFFSRKKAVPKIGYLPGPSGSNKNALVSYIKDVLYLDENDPALNDHTSKWESREIAHIFQRLGYNVDIVDYNDTAFYPTKEYDVVFDIHYNIDRLAAFLPERCLKILHVTGSYPAYSIAQELKRVKDLEERRHAHYSPKRIVDNVYFTRSMEKADFCTLFGNEFTVSTFPAELQNKIHLVTPTASQLKYQKKSGNYNKGKKSFLWFYGSGAVHKGLDLVLEVFAKRSDINLHIIGSVDREKDFCKIYDRELFHTANIHFHGFLNALSKGFADIVKNCFCFIAPSCSESLSVAAAACLQIGLYPILSRQNGIDLPNDYGIILEEVSISNIEKAIDRVLAMDEKALEEQTIACQQMALEKFSRPAFTKIMTNAIETAIKGKENG